MAKPYIICARPKNVSCTRRRLRSSRRAASARSRRACASRGFSAEVSVCAALKAVAEYASLATPARWEETVRGLLAAPHLPLVEVYSAARRT